MGEMAAYVENERGMDELKGIWEDIIGTVDCFLRKGMVIVTE